MADPKDPKTEPAPITAPPRPETNPPGAGTESREPVRINLPTRPPVRPAPPPGAPPPPPRPAASVPSAGPELKKETARVGAAPLPEVKPATPVQMKKTQPLVTMPEVTAPPSVPLTVTSEPLPAVEPIPPPPFLGVVGVSAAVFMFQIWNYFS